MIIISDSGGRILVDSITIMFRVHYYYYENHITGSLQAVSCVIKREWLDLTLTTLFCNVRHCSLVDSYGSFRGIPKIYFENWGSALLSNKFLLANLTVTQLVDVLFSPFDRSRTFIIYFITVRIWYKSHCCSPSTSSSWQVLLFFMVFRLRCRMKLLNLPCMLHALSSYCSWSNNQKHSFDTQCTVVYCNQF